MPSPEPIPGRCGAKTPARLDKHGAEVPAGFCTQHPNRGRQRCRHHDKHGTTIVSGAYSRHFKDEHPIVQAELDAMLQDPDLLEARRPVAIQAVLVHRIGLVPSDDVVLELARHSTGAKEPTPAQLEIARRKYMAESAKLVGHFQKAVLDAARQVKIGEIVNAELQPLFAEYGRRIRVLIDAFVPVEHRDEFIAAVRREARNVIVLAAQIGQE